MNQCWPALAALLCVSASGPPSPPGFRAPRKSPEITQGSGAMSLIAPKVVIIPPKPYTNHLELRWTYSNWTKLDQPFPGLVVRYDTNLHRLATNYFEAQVKWKPNSPWVVLGVTNQSPFRIVTTNRSGWFRVRSFMA